MKYLMRLLLFTFVASACSGDKGTNSGGNRPPTAPTSPTPVNGAINQNTTISLSWMCSDPEGDPLTFDVYFGSPASLSLVSTGQLTTAYDPGALDASVTYSWQIVAKDNHGNSTSGPVWSFTTESILAQVGFYTTPSLIVDVAASGNVAFVADRNNGLYVVDVADPFHPSEIGHLDSLESTYGLIARNQLVYVIGRVVSGRSTCLSIVDVSIPSVPTKIGQWDTTTFNTIGFYHGAIQGDYVYVTADRGLMVFNVADSTQPAMVGWYQGITGNYDPWAIAVDGWYAYVADRYDGLRIFQVSTPNAPTIVRTYELPFEMNETWGAAARDGRAYVAASYGGLVMLNMADPMNPALTATQGCADGYRLSLAWPYAFLLCSGYPERNIVVMDVSNSVNPITLGAWSATTYIGGLFATATRLFVFDDFQVSPTNDTLRIFEFTP